MDMFVLLASTVIVAGAAGGKSGMGGLSGMMYVAPTC
jgi:hypothetical protein